MDARAAVPATLPACLPARNDPLRLPARLPACLPAGSGSPYELAHMWHPPAAAGAAAGCGSNGSPHGRDLPGGWVGRGWHWCIQRCSGAAAEAAAGRGGGGESDVRERDVRSTVLRVQRSLQHWSCCLSTLRLPAACPLLLAACCHPLPTASHPPVAPTRVIAAACCRLPLQVNLWWLLLCFAGSSYVCWMREQRAREAFARQLGGAGEVHLRRLRQGHPLFRCVRMRRVLLAEGAGPAGGLCFWGEVGRCCWQRQRGGQLSP